jgi:hypothetical protein
MSAARRIDVHHHYYPPKYLQEVGHELTADSPAGVSRPADWSVARDLEHMDANGVTRSVLSLEWAAQLARVSRHAEVVR